MDKRHTILVVDDESDVVKSVQDLLRLEYRVLGTTSARDAVKIMAEEEVHVVMTDLRMPGMTGVEFLKQIRGQHPDAIRLLFTGYTDMKAVIDSINEGNVYRYITKPWDPDELLMTIREACERYELIVARKVLAEQLQQKNAELVQSNEELRQANMLKQAFIRVASHELRTPLAILLGLVSLAQESRDLMPLDESLARVKQVGERLHIIVEQLVEMLQAQRFEQVLQKISTDLTGLLEQAADDVRPFAMLRKQELKLELQPQLGTIEVDTAKIRDSVNHLLLNAIKFTPDGGHITLAACRQEKIVAIRVTDDGIGMDAEMVKRVFQPFFTGFDASHHASGHFEFKRQGMGLGLSIARAFIEMHRGTIRVISEPNKGTTFTISLPVG